MRTEYVVNLIQLDGAIGSDEFLKPLQKVGVFKITKYGDLFTFSFVE